MDTITLSARAKVNFTLAVLGRRADGYHTVDSLMHSVTLADAVTLAPADGLSLTVAGAAPAGADNLAWRAAALFLETVRPPFRGARIHLVKRIPSEAGLGGGSSDAAAVLRGLNRLAGRPLSMDALCAMGARLGADVPFCVRGGCARASGIGADLAPLALWEGLSLLLVKPEASVSTAAAYRAVDEKSPVPERTGEEAAAALREKDAARLAAALYNSFEDALFPDHPVLADTAAELRAYGPALMTGSGAAFFLLLGGAAREAAKTALRARHPAWFVAEAETCGEETL